MIFPVAGIVLAGTMAGAQLMGPAPGVGSTLWPFGPPVLLAPADVPPRDGAPDVYVMAVRPGQNRVPYFDFHWRIDTFRPVPGGGKVRLLLYDRERGVASYAVAAMRRELAELSQAMGYVPTRQFAYVLYGTLPEFYTTNVFDVAEGVLGVTSPIDLRTSLPFFGDLERFDEVSAHELAHQVSIQKVRSRAESEAYGDPLDLMPGWFIEGLAEYYSKGQKMDVEGDVYIRDLVVNPDREREWVLPELFDDHARGYLGVYKLGQVKCLFLDQAYGAGTVTKILDDAPDLTGVRFVDKARGDRFALLVAEVTGQSKSAIEARYRDWMKQRYFPQALAAKQRPSDWTPLKGTEDTPDAFVVSPDGKLVLYRAIERNTAISTLSLQDLSNPDQRVTVIRDHRSGAESLHPADYRAMALGNGLLAYSARAGAGDVLYVQSFQHERTKLSLGSRTAYPLTDRGILQAMDPALSPDGKTLAFVGVDVEGFSDIYLLALAGPAPGELRRVTRDIWAERDLAYQGGALLFTSDATPSGKRNLFRLDLASGREERLTVESADEHSPVPGKDGVLFRSNRGGKPDLWLLDARGTARRITDVETGAWEGAWSGDELLALSFRRGRYVMQRLSKDAPRLEETAVLAPLGEVKAREPPREDIPEALEMYEAFSARNWQVEAAAAGLLGIGSAGSGAVAITDLLRDHLLLVNAAIYGSLKLTDASAVYINQRRRPLIGFGPFTTFEPLRDQLFPQVLNFYYARYFGVVGLAEEPLSRFERLQGAIELRGVQRFGFTDVTGDLGQAWQARLGGTEPDGNISLAYGYDTTQLDPDVGPISGRSVFIQALAGYLPRRTQPYGRLALDVQQRLRLNGRANLLARLAGGTGVGGIFAPQFFLSSVDNLRGYEFGDHALLGRHYYVANLQLNAPLDVLVRTPIFASIIGVAGLDFGAAFDRMADAWAARSLAGVLGVDLSFGGLALRLEWGKLITAPAGAARAWVFNLSLKLLYY